MARPYHWRWIFAGGIALMAGTALLYFGGTMTFLVPGSPGESFLQKDRVLFGILPLLSATVTLSTAGWCLFRGIGSPRSNKDTSLSSMIAYCFLGSIGMIWLFFMLAAVIHR